MTATCEAPTVLPAPPVVLERRHWLAALAMLFVLFAPYQTLVQTLPQNILRKDQHGRFTFANRKFCKSIGKSLEEIVKAL